MSRELNTKYLLYALAVIFLCGQLFKKVRAHESLESASISPTV